MKKKLQSGLAVFFVVAAALLGLGPVYSANHPLQLAPKQCQTLYSAEQPTTGAFSIQFQVPVSDQQPTRNLSFTLSWPSAPGSFNIQVQDADQDITGNYVSVTTPGTSTPIQITSAPQTPGSGNFVARLELNPWQGNFGRLYINSQPTNAVNLTATVCR